MNTPNMLGYYLINLLQLAVLLVSVTLIALFNSQLWLAYSLGGLNAILPYAWFTYRVISTGKVRKSAQVVAMAGRGILEKYLLSAIGFLSIFIIFDQIDAIFIFVGFIVMLATQLIGTIVINGSKFIN